MELRRTDLIRRQLVLVLLIRNQSTDFHGEETITSGIDQRKFPVLERNLVLLFKVFVDGSFFLFKASIG
jgi:hypothetical protein